ncbi:MAG: hypothetical protein ACE5GJ_11125 [Gemmatimonadota bacterium]
MFLILLLLGGGLWITPRTPLIGWSIPSHRHPLASGGESTRERDPEPDMIRDAEIRRLAGQAGVDPRIVDLDYALGWEECEEAVREARKDKPPVTSRLNLLRPRIVRGVEGLLLGGLLLGSPLCGGRFLGPTPLSPLPLSAQQTVAQLSATPEAAAEAFLRSVRAIRFETATRFVHPRTLARFYELVTMMVEADTTGFIANYLTDSSRDTYRRLSAREVVSRSLGSMIDDMPGLMHAIYDRDDEVSGHVTEGRDTAHVVYRTTARISGAVPEVKVMQLIRTPRGWRVLWSDELEVLDAALRGVGRARPPPPAPDALSLRKPAAPPS